MPPSGRKRARRASSELQEAGPAFHPSNAAAEDAPTASHLVSFLSSYADRDRRSQSGSDGEGSGSSGSEADDNGHDDDEDDGGKPRQQGLVGTPGRNKRKTATPSSTPRKRTPAKPKARLPFGSAVDEGFLRTSRADSYFVAASRASRTSGSSYCALARPLSQAEYEAAANGARRSDVRVGKALEDAACHFPQWAAELEAGFNLLIYGYGSKRRLVNRFVRAELERRGHCAIVNGHFPQLGLRNVLTTLEDTLAIADAPFPPAASPLERAAYRVYARFATKGATPLFLILHNIDAPALRTPRALAALSLLASSPGIHLVATFDHVHTPLLFSSSLSNASKHDTNARADSHVPSSRGFNWLYHAASTFDDYDVELSYARLSAASLGALGQGGAAGISEEGAMQILRSVPPMAARLLKLILTRQVASLPSDTAGHAAHPPSSSAPAFALDIDLLQRAARDKFIAREEDRFNALLGEFRDHGLVAVAELDIDGRSGRWGWVPLGKAAIERILDEMRVVEA